jgi:hypothetical protein
MPESIIKKVEQFGKSNAQPNTLNFAKRNKVLFKWNDEVDEYTEGHVDKDMVLYPSLTAEIPWVVLEQDLPIPTIDDKIVPQGLAKDAMARNANLKPLDVAGVGAPTILCANNDEIAKINNKDNGILSIATIPGKTTMTH